jgi:hypothetical protein
MSDHSGIFSEDLIFDGITYRELIVTMHCNEQVIDARSMRKVFKQIMEHNLQDALDRLARNAPSILGEVKSMRDS